MRGVIDKIIGRNEEAAEVTGEIYIKAIPLKAYEDVDIIKSEVRGGNVVITNVSPLAKQNIDDVKRAINELNEYAVLIQGYDTRSQWHPRFPCILGRRGHTLCWLRIWNRC